MIDRSWVDTNGTAATRFGTRAAAMLALLAGTSGALAQNAGLGSMGDEPDATAQPSGESAPAGEDLDFSVTVDGYDLVDLHVNNEDLGRVLQLLSIQSERNIVTSPSVDTTVTADLYGATFYEALEAILNVNGFAYIEKGNFIYVYTQEEYDQIVEAARARVSRVVTLRYLNAIDAAQFVAQLLSESGSITTNEQTESFSLPGDSPVGADTFASSSTIVIYDYEENVDAILALLDQLDTRPVQVLVEATILQTTLTENNAFGVDFAILNNLDFSDFVGHGPLNPVGALIDGFSQNIDGSDVLIPGGNGNGSAANTNIGNVGGPATLKLGLVNEDVAFFMRVLDSVTDVTVVSNPKVLTTNRQPARVLVGTRVGYLNTTTTETATTQTVEFLDVGTQLALRPFVGENGMIRLELRPQVSSFNLREVTNNDGGAITIPDENTTELTTNVMVRDGQTVVLGGLFSETTTATRRQVPVLGNIPLIGSAFRGHDDETRRSEIIFLITPSLVNETMIAEDGDLALRYIEHVGVGARKGLLPWSRERRVGQMLIQARNLADAGQVDEAIMKVRRALRLAPQSPEARALLEELTGTQHNSPSRSLMDGILHREGLSGGSRRHGGGWGRTGTSPNPYAAEAPTPQPVNRTATTTPTRQSGSTYTENNDTVRTTPTTTTVVPSATNNNGASNVNENNSYGYDETDDTGAMPNSYNPNGNTWDNESWDDSWDEPTPADNTGDEMGDANPFGSNTDPFGIAPSTTYTAPTASNTTPPADWMGQTGGTGWITGEATGNTASNNGTRATPFGTADITGNTGDTASADDAWVTSPTITRTEPTFMEDWDAAAWPRLGHAATFRGVLVVPVPGGGAITVPWPEQLDANTQTYTEVPTDTE